MLYMALQIKMWMKNGSCIEIAEDIEHEWSAERNWRVEKIVNSAK